MNNQNKVNKSIESNGRSYKNYILPLVLSILILGTLSVFATNYINENTVTSPLGNFTTIEGQNITIIDNTKVDNLNITGTVYGLNNKTTLDCNNVTGSSGSLCSNQTLSANNYADSQFIKQANESNLNVNKSDYWDNLSTINSTQMENSGGTLSILESWLNAGWCKLTGCTITGDLNITSGNIYAGNVTINETGQFYSGQKTSVRTADVVVCRGTSLLDDLYKSFTCDVVCASTDSDCGDNINNACKGNHCLLMEGTYSTTTTINLTSYSYLEGEGMFLTLINYTQTSGSAIRSSGSINDVGIQIENLGIDGNAQINTDYNFGYGIMLHNITNFLVDKVYIKNTEADGVNIGGSIAYFGKVINSYFYNISREGIQLEYGNNILIDNNNFDTINNRAINIENLRANSLVDSITITNNIINHFCIGGIVVSDTNSANNLTNIIISNNVISGLIPCFGIYTTDTIYGIKVVRVGTNALISGVVINANTVRNLLNSTASGIFVQVNNGGLVSVDSNILSNIGKYGILGSSKKGLLISNNILSNLGDVGIQLDDEQIMTIGNVIINASTYGIRTENDYAYNNTVMFNKIYGGSLTAGIRALGSDGTYIGNVINDATDKYSAVPTSNYIDNYDYSGTLPSCSASGVFSGNTIHNSTTSCTCTGGAWKCWVMS